MRFDLMELHSTSPVQKGGQPMQPQTARPEKDAGNFRTKLYEHYQTQIGLTQKANNV